MHSFGKHGLVAAGVAVVLFVCAEAVAQTATARSRYESASARDQELRPQIASSPATSPPPDLLKQVDQVVTSYEVLVRRFPASGYADNALYEAAALAETAYTRFNRAEDRERALRFYRWLVKEYPVSGYVKQAQVKLATLNEPPGRRRR